MNWLLRGSSPARAVARALGVLLVSTVMASAGEGPAGAGPTMLPEGLPAETAAPADDLVRAALADNPSVAALRDRIASAREMVTSAGALADPMVEAMYTEAGFPNWTVGTVEMSMIGVEVRQDLSRRSKRTAREDIARADVAMREADIEMLRRQIERDVRILYSKIYAIDQELRNLAPGRELLDLIAETMSSRYSTGEGDQESVIKAQLMRTRLDERRADLVADRRRNVAAIGRLLNRPAGFTLGRVDALAPVDFPAGDWAEMAGAQSAEVLSRHKAVAAAERRLESARLELKPNFSAAAATYYRGSMDPVVTLKFGVELPFWRQKKQEPMIRAAERELEAARRDLDSEIAGVREMTARIAITREQSEDQLRRYRDGILPQTSAAFDAARSAYLNSRADFATVIEDFNLWLDARTEVARRESDLFMAWAELQALTSPALELPEGGH